MVYLPSKSNQGGKRVIHLLYDIVQFHSNTFHLSLSLRPYHAARRSHRSCRSFASVSFSSLPSSSNFPCLSFATSFKPKHPCLMIPRLASLKGGSPYMAWGWSQQVARPTTPLTPPWRLPQYIVCVSIYQINDCDVIVRLADFI